MSPVLRHIFFLAFDACVITFCGFGTLSTPIASEHTSVRYKHGTNITHSLSSHETCSMINDLPRDIIFQQQQMDIDSEGIFIQ
jgi:hypothetical protein